VGSADPAMSGLSATVRSCGRRARYPGRSSADCAALGPTPAGKSSQSATTKAWWRPTSPAMAAWRFPGPPTCAAVVVIGTDDADILLDRPAAGRDPRAADPPAVGGPAVGTGRQLGRPPPALHQGAEDIYRLTHSSATDLEAVLGGPPGAPIPLFRTRRHRSVPADAEPLFRPADPADRIATRPRQMRAFPQRGL
jgi:hypothetical protein